MKDDLPLVTGPSRKILEPKVFAETLRERFFLFPSIVLISIIEEILPPFTKYIYKDKKLSSKELSYLLNDIGQIPCSKSDVENGRKI